MLRPLGNNILLEFATEEQTTAGGIYIPDASRERPDQGVVVAVGPGKTLENGLREEMDITVGDTVLVQKYGGTDLKFDGKEYRVVTKNDILGIVED